MQTLTAYTVGLLQIGAFIAVKIIYALIQFAMPFVALGALVDIFSFVMVPDFIRHFAAAVISTATVVAFTLVETPLTNPPTEWAVVSWAPLLLLNGICMGLSSAACKHIRAVADGPVRTRAAISLLHYTVFVLCLWDPFVLTYRLEDANPKDNDPASTLAFLQASSVGRWADIIFALGALMANLNPTISHKLRYKYRISSLQILPVMARCVACFWFTHPGHGNTVGSMGSVVLVDAMFSVYNHRDVLLKRMVLLGPMSKAPRWQAHFWNWVTNGVVVYGWKASPRVGGEDCPICLCELSDPPNGGTSITLACGHSLHEYCAVDCLQKRQLCPLCKVWPSKERAMMAVVDGMPAYMSAVGLGDVWERSVASVAANDEANGRPPTPRRHVSEFQSTAFAEYLMAEMGSLDMPAATATFTIPHTGGEPDATQPLVQFSVEINQRRFGGKRNRNDEDHPTRRVVGPAALTMPRRRLTVRRGKRTVRDEDPEVTTQKKSRVDDTNPTPQ